MTNCTCVYVYVCMRESEREIDRTHTHTYTHTHTDVVGQTETVRQRVRETKRLCWRDNYIAGVLDYAIFTFW